MLLIVSIVAVIGTLLSPSFLHLAHAKDTFSELTASAFSDIQCVPYAYGDFNADKRIDIFCVSKSGRQIEIWLAQDREPLFSRFNSFSLK